MSWSWSRGSRCGEITSVRSPLPHSPGRRKIRCRSRAALKEGNKGYRSDQIHCGGGACFGTRRGCRIIVASEDFATSRMCNGESKPTAAGDVALVLGEVVEKSAHPRISLPLMILLQVHFTSTFSICFGCCRGCCRICGAARVCLFHWR